MLFLLAFFRLLSIDRFRLTIPLTKKALVAVWCRTHSSTCIAAPPMSASARPMGSEAPLVRIAEQTGKP
ncbi:hypothetical protein [Mesorhizobium sp.]|uniref:hypothetical protein n=1 Tax=Mesorhizobium sp. TaxID=1871066 RepID=UPI0012099346|nr:hypothetical protein [Mesorhizobium sp.]TIT01038.1 MAG: hypothetical protein E5W87_16780 [Mesorhizobium sp.]